MRYQWGRKDPFTFATSSESSGKHPVKLYNSSNVLIHQVDNGGDNTNMLPSGGVLVQSSPASSMSVAIINPITLYSGSPVTGINQSGQSSDLYNYYWSSHSRGTDGAGSWGNGNSNQKSHNLYLDSYIPSRLKSIYDPCPYGYRMPSNGTYNEFTSNELWTGGDYARGFPWNNTWFVCSGWRIYNSSNMNAVGFYVGYFLSTVQSESHSYVLDTRNGIVYKGWGWMKSVGSSIRCIEDCSVVSDATEASAGY